MHASTRLSFQGMNQPFGIILVFAYLILNASSKSYTQQQVGEQQMQQTKFQTPIAFPENGNPHIINSPDDYNEVNDLWNHEDLIVPFEEKPDNFDGYNSDRDEPYVNAVDEFGIDFEGNGDQRKHEQDKHYKDSELSSPAPDREPAIGNKYDDRVTSDGSTYSQESDEHSDEDGTKNKFNSWLSKVFGPGGQVEASVMRSYNDVKGILKKTSDDIWSSIKINHPELYESLKDMKKWFTKSVSEFGLMVQKGAEYMADRCSVIFNLPEASDILHRLDKKLQEGDEAVSKFFDIVGYKISKWSEAKDLEVSEFGNSNGQTQQQHYSDHFGDASYPDLFQDPEVHSQLDVLVSNKILRKEEAELLTQQKKI